MVLFSSIQQINTNLAFFSETVKLLLSLKLDRLQEIIKTFILLQSPYVSIKKIS